MKFLSLTWSISDTWCLCPKFTRQGYPNCTPRYKHQGLQLSIAFIAAFLRVNSLANVGSGKDLVLWNASASCDLVFLTWWQPCPLRTQLSCPAFSMCFYSTPYIEMMPRTLGHCSLLCLRFNSCGTHGRLEYTHHCYFQDSSDFLMSW